MAVLAGRRKERHHVPSLRGRRTARLEPRIGSTVLAGGIRTNYDDEGSGPPVVLVHGSGPGVSAWATWRLTMPQLAHRFRVLAPEVGGFGYTERPSPARYDLDGWTSHLVGFLDAMELDRVAVVGNSFGGALALNLAARHPARVHKLVLMGSAGAPVDLTPGLDAVWGFEPSLASMRHLLDVFAHDRDLVDDDLARLRLGAATRPGVQEAYVSMFPAPGRRTCAPSPWTMTWCARSASRHCSCTDATTK